MKGNSGHFYSQNVSHNHGIMSNNFMKSNVDKLSETIPEEGIEEY